ncbi:MAG: hypothetical protein KJ066_19220 [Acidobacteria bacterium]|nr:hypothetical protein [Acidobacteriota bacterium]
MNGAQARRLREMRARTLVRAFDYRQRRLARGVWFRLRRVLAFASEAYAMTGRDAEQLVADGHIPEPVGLELEPARVVVFVSRDRVAGVESARPLTVRLGAELLRAEALALVPFPGVSFERHHRT